ncbi:MAG: hypothetical protein ABIY55_09995, partial [Kofleriaceae bacterium]
MDQVPHLDDLHRVKAASRLVEDQELRLMNDRLRDTDALPKPMRQRSDRFPGHIAERGDLEDVG